jgi:hypothetical protein
MSGARRSPRADGKSFNGMGTPQTSPASVCYEIEYS